MSVAKAEPRPRVLLVDDERDVVEAIALNLRRKFDIVTANSGTAALAALTGDPTIAVVVSDMQMPGMTGAQWLAQAYDRGHDAVRLLLTGHADLTSAIEAVNNGHIFRFLTKPCPRHVLESALEAAVAQHRLMLAERELLEQTLHGSIKILVDVLGFARPGLFGRANRIKAHAMRLADAAELKERWQIEVAAMLSYIGCVTLPDALAAKIEAGHLLSEPERKQVAQLPAITEQLLGHVPRLDEVRAILAAQDRPPRLDPSAGPRRKLVALSAHILHAATLLDALDYAGDPDPIETLASRIDLDPVVSGALRKLATAPERRTMIKEVGTSALRVGMVFGDDVHLVSGALLVARGYEVTASFLERIRNFMPGAIREPLRIVVTIDQRVDGSEQLNLVGGQPAR